MCLRLIITVPMLSVAFTCLAQENQIVEQQRPRVERIDAVPSASGLRLISSVRTMRESSPDGRSTEYVKLTMFNVKHEEPAPDERPYAEMFGFDLWAPVIAGSSSCYIVATDVAGINPFDRPDNPIPRLWLFQLSFTAVMPRVEALSFIEQKTAFEAFAGRAIRPDVAPNAPVTTYISPDRALDSVQQIDVALRDDASGFCAGLSRRAAWSKLEKDMDVLRRKPPLE